MLVKLTNNIYITKYDLMVEHGKISIIVFIVVPSSEFSTAILYNDTS